MDGLKKDLVLQHMTGKGQNEGREFSYEQYFVEVNGVKLVMKPADNTAKQILSSYFGVIK